MKKTSEKIIFKAKWLTLIEDTFINQNNEEVRWERVERTQHKLIITIIPKLIPSNRIVLIRQFRAPINNYVLGLPAGAINNDDIEHEALKELKEETGYIGKITAISPYLSANAGIINDRVVLVNVEIDENAPENINPVQELEPSEEIEVVLVKKEDGKALLLSELEKGNLVGSGLWTMFCID